MTPTRRRARRTAVSDASQTTARRRRRGSKNEPFIILAIKVGASILLVCSVAYSCVVFWRLPSGGVGFGSPSNGDDVVDIGEQPLAKLHGAEKNNAGNLPPFPQFDLGEAVADAYAISDTLLQPFIAEGANIGGPLKGFIDVASKLREEFSSRYGGENAARAILMKGLSTFRPRDKQKDEKNMTGGRMSHLPEGIRHTANRIRMAHEEKRPFRMAFGGYSVTAGRGNYFKQSFPFVMERLLAEPMQMLGVELEVRNAAIGGVPSFPYGWCLRNFLGSDPDVVSWDYSMNEAGGLAKGLEAYIRHTMTMDHQPMVIVKDTETAKPRQEVLQRYVDLGALMDPLVVHVDPAAEPFLALSDEIMPTGFQDWRNFGAPPGAPGQARHHPAVKEHELIGWMISMHILSALELVAVDVMQSDKQSGHTWSLGLSSFYLVNRFLPAPIASLESVQEGSNKSSLDPTSILFGIPVNASSTETPSPPWTMNPVQCATSFDPVVGGDINHLIVSGTTGADLDLMLPKGAGFYNKGWVLDMSQHEKAAKRKLQRYGGLGFIDSKKAYYGIYASGSLHLFLPCEGQVGQISNSIEKNGNVIRRAKQFFRSLVVCEVNEKRDEGECKIEKDIAYTVGGVETTDVRLIKSEGVSYLGKNLCVIVGIPDGAKTTTRHLMEVNLTSVAPEIDDRKKSSVIGLAVEMRVTNKKVVLKKGPCSVSHVVWELSGN